MPFSTLDNPRTQSPENQNSPNSQNIEQARASFERQFTNNKRPLIQEYVRAMTENFAGGRVVETKDGNIRVEAGSMMKEIGDVMSGKTSAWSKLKSFGRNALKYMGRGADNIQVGDKNFNLMNTQPVIVSLIEELDSARSLGLDLTEVLSSKLQELSPLMRDEVRQVLVEGSGLLNNGPEYEKEVNTAMLNTLTSILKAVDRRAQIYAEGTNNSSVQEQLTQFLDLKAEVMKGDSNNRHLKTETRLGGPASFVKGWVTKVPHTIVETITNFSSAIAPKFSGLIQGIGAGALTGVGVVYQSASVLQMADLQTLAAAKKVSEKEKLFRMSGATPEVVLQEVLAETNKLLAEAMSRSQTEGNSFKKMLSVDSMGLSSDKFEDFAYFSGQDFQVISSLVESLILEIKQQNNQDNSNSELVKVAQEAIQSLNQQAHEVQEEKVEKVINRLNQPPSENKVVKSIRNLFGWVGDKAKKTNEFLEEKTEFYSSAKTSLIQTVDNLVKSTKTTTAEAVHWMDNQAMLRPIVNYFDSNKFEARLLAKTILKEIPDDKLEILYQDPRVNDDSPKINSRDSLLRYLSNLTTQELLQLISRHIDQQKLSQIFSKVANEKSFKTVDRHWGIAKSWGTMTAQSIGLGFLIKQLGNAFNGAVDFGSTLQENLGINTSSGVTSQVVEASYNGQTVKIFSGHENNITPKSGFKIVEHNGFKVEIPAGESFVPGNMDFSSVDAPVLDLKANGAKLDKAVNGTWALKLQGLVSDNSSQTSNDFTGSVKLANGSTLKVDGGVSNEIVTIEGQKYAINGTNADYKNRGYVELLPVGKAFSTPDGTITQVASTVGYSEETSDQTFAQAEESAPTQESKPAPEPTPKLSRAEKLLQQGRQSAQARAQTGQTPKFSTLNDSPKSAPVEKVLQVAKPQPQKEADTPKPQPVRTPRATPATPKVEVSDSTPETPEPQTQISQNRASTKSSQPDLASRLRESRSTSVVEFKAETVAQTQTQEPVATKPVVIPEVKAKVETETVVVQAKSQVVDPTPTIQKVQSEIKPAPEVENSNIDTARNKDLGNSTWNAQAVLDGKNGWEKPVQEVKVNNPETVVVSSQTSGVGDVARGEIPRQSNNPNTFAQVVVPTIPTEHNRQIPQEFEPTSRSVETPKHQSKVVSPAIYTGDISVKVREYDIKIRNLPQNDPAVAEVQARRRAQIELYNSRVTLPNGEVVVVGPVLEGPRRTEYEERRYIEVTKLVPRVQQQITDKFTIPNPEHVRQITERISYNTKGQLVISSNDSKFVTVNSYKIQLSKVFNNPRCTPQEQEIALKKYFTLLKAEEQALTNLNRQRNTSPIPAPTNSRPPDSNTVIVPTIQGENPDNGSLTAQNIARNKDLNTTEKPDIKNDNPEPIVVPIQESTWRGRLLSRTNENQTKVPTQKPSPLETLHNERIRRAQQASQSGVVVSTIENSTGTVQVPTISTPASEGGETDQSGQWSPENIENPTFTNKANPSLVAKIRNLNGDEFNNNPKALSELIKGANQVELASYNTLKQIASLVSDGKKIPDNILSAELPGGMSAQEYYQIFKENPKAAQKVLQSRTNAYIKFVDLKQQRSGSILPLPIGGLFVSATGEKSSSALIIGGTDIDSENPIVVGLPNSNEKPFSPDSGKPSTMQFDRRTGRLVVRYPAFKVVEDKDSSFSVAGVSIQDKTLSQQIRLGKASDSDILHYIYKQNPNHPLVRGTLEIDPNQNISAPTVDINGESTKLSELIGNQSNNYFEITNADGSTVEKNKLIDPSVVNTKNVGLTLEIIFNPDNPHVSLAQRRGLAWELVEAEGYWRNLDELTPRQRNLYAANRLLRDRHPEIYQKLKTGSAITSNESRQVLANYNFSSAGIVSDVIQSKVVNSYHGYFKQYDRFLVGSGLLRRIDNLNPQEAIKEWQNLMQYLKDNADLTPRQLINLQSEQRHINLINQQEEIKAINRKLGINDEAPKVEKGGGPTLGFRGIGYKETSSFEYGNGGDNITAIRALLKANPKLERVVEHWTNITGLPVGGVGLGGAGTNVVGGVLSRFLPLPGGFVASGSSSEETSTLVLSSQQIDTATRLFKASTDILGSKKLIQEYRAVLENDSDITPQQAFVQMMTPKTGKVGNKYYVKIDGKEPMYFSTREERDAVLNVVSSAVVELQAQAVQGNNGVKGVTITSNHIITDSRTIKVSAKVEGIENLRPDVQVQLTSSLDKLTKNFNERINTTRNIQEFRKNGKMFVMTGRELKARLGQVVGSSQFGTGGPNPFYDRNNPKPQLFVANDNELFTGNVSDLEAMEKGSRSNMALIMLKCNNASQITSFQFTQFEYGQKTNINPAPRDQMSSTSVYYNEQKSQFDLFGWVKFPQPKPAPREQKTEFPEPGATPNTKPSSQPGGDNPIPTPNTPGGGNPNLQPGSNPNQPLSPTPGATIEVQPVTQIPSTPQLPVNPNVVQPPQIQNPVAPAPTPGPVEFPSAISDPSFDPNSTPK